MVKFNLLLAVLRDLQKAGILRHFILVGSWCQDLYRHRFGNPVQIPAAHTVDIDLLLPKKLPITKPVNIHKILERHGFVTRHDYLSGLVKFTHPELDIEFLTDPGAKRKEEIHQYKQLGISAQELRYMSIPLQYHQAIRYRGVTLNIPEPEAFTLHKLIVSTLRKKAEKAANDIDTAKGMLLYFSGKPKHGRRLRQIYRRFPKGWQSKVNRGLVIAEMSLPE